MMMLKDLAVTVSDCQGMLGSDNELISVTTSSKKE